MANTPTKRVDPVVVELPLGRETKNTIRYEVAEGDNQFGDFAITPLYIQKSALREFYEANGTWPQRVKLIVELT